MYRFPSFCGLLRAAALLQITYCGTSREHAGIARGTNAESASSVESAPELVGNGAFAGRVETRNGLQTGIDDPGIIIGLYGNQRAGGRVGNLLGIEGRGLYRCRLVDRQTEFRTLPRVYSGIIYFNLSMYQQERVRRVRIGEVGGFGTRKIPPSPWRNTTGKDVTAVSERTTDALVAQSVGVSHKSCGGGSPREACPS